LIRHVKRRYLAFQIESLESLEKEEIRDAIWNSLIQLFGEYGASQSGLFLVEYDKQKKQAILRCSLKALSMVHASIASVIKIEDKPVGFHVLRISGTLRALNKKLPPSA